MNTNTTAASDNEILRQFDDKNRVQIPLGRLVLVVAIAVIAIGGYQFYQRLPWVEVLGADLIRTNASSETIAKVREAVIPKHQNWVIKANGNKSDPSFRESGQVWSDGSSLKQSRVKISRATTQFTDKNSNTFTLERISATGSPTLIFIEYHDTGVKQAVMNDLLTEFKNLGVNLR